MLCSGGRGTVFVFVQDKDHGGSGANDGGLGGNAGLLYDCVIFDVLKGLGACGEGRSSIRDTVLLVPP